MGSDVHGGVMIQWNLLYGTEDAKAFHANREGYDMLDVLLNLLYSKYDG